MSFVNVDLSGIPKTFDQMMSWVKKGDENRAEFRQENEDEVDQANFQSYLDGGSVPVVADATALTGDALASGLYGSGTWSDDGNSYTVGAADSVSLTPNEGWVFEVQVALPDEAATTELVMPEVAFTETTENAVVTLLRVQTPPLEDANGDDLGVFTLNPSTHTESSGAALAKRGCTDDTAENYDDTAVLDDGSCEYAEWYQQIPVWGWAVGGVAVLALVMGRR